VVGIVLAYLANPLIEWLERHRWPRGAAVAAGGAAIAGVLVLCGLLVVPVLVEQVNALVQRLPGYRDAVLSWIHSNLPGIAPWWEYLTDHWDDIAQRISSAASVMLGVIGGWIVGLFGLIGTLIVGFIIAIYVLLDYDRLRQWLVGLLPGAYRESTLAAGRSVSEVLGAYLRGLAALVVVMGALVTALMAILGFPYWLLLGVLVGVGYAIPYFGLPVATAVAVLIAVVAGPVGWVKILVLIGAVVVLNIVGDYLLTPRLVGQKVGLHPLAVIFALLAGGALLGIVGMILAIPVAASVKVILYQAYPDLFKPAALQAPSAASPGQPAEPGSE
jgi:predicted PurR-regulated permease PerM